MDDNTKTVYGTILTDPDEIMSVQRLRIKELEAKVRDLETEVKLYHAQRDRLQGMLAGITDAGWRGQGMAQG